MGITLLQTAKTTRLSPLHSNPPPQITLDPATQWLANVLKGKNIPCPQTLDCPDTEILRAGYAHGVLPLLHGLATNAPNPIDCPDEFLQQIKQKNRKSAATELRRHLELEHIFGLLHAENLRFLVMKGSVLAHTLYAQPHFRERSDTDLLFPDKRSSDKAWEILQNEGYERRNTLDGEFVGYQFSCGRELSKGFYSALDIHRKLNDIGYFANMFEFDELFDQSILIPELGSDTRGFNPVYSLLLACIHRIINIPLGVDANRLIWIYDMHLLCNSFSEQQWQTFCALAIDKQLAGVCLDGLYLSEQFFDTRIPHEHREKLVENAKKERFSPHKIKTRRDLYQLDFISNKGLINKARQLKEHLFPSIKFMMNKYQPKSKLLLPYLYVVRIVKGLKKYS